MRVGVMCLLLAVSSATIRAQSGIERPPEGYAKNMREIHVTVMNLRDGIQQKDFDEIATQASKLKLLLLNTQTFWEDRRALKAVTRSKAAYDAASLLLEAARSREFSRLLAGHHALTSSCVSCHSERRDRLPDGSYGIK